MFNLRTILEYFQQNLFKSVFRGEGNPSWNGQAEKKYEHSVNNNSPTFAKLHSRMRTCSLVPQCFAWAYCRKMKTNCECWCMLMFTGTCDWVCASVDKGMRISIDLARFGVHGQVEQEDVVALSLQLGYIVDDVKDQGSLQGGSQRTNKQEKNRCRQFIPQMQVY